MRKYQSSRTQFYKEVIKGNNSKTQHMNIKLYSSESELIDLSRATISATAVPTSGTIDSLKNPNNTNPVVFKDNEIVTITIDLKEVKDIHHIEVRHINSGYLEENSMQLSIESEDWFTIYDTRESGIYNEDKPLKVKTNYWYEIDPLSKIILDIEDSSFFNPKLMIWDNDNKLLNFLKNMMSRSQYYKMDSDSTNSLIHLVNDEGNYPSEYFDNIMVNWVQLGSVAGVEQIKIKIGGLKEVNAKFPGSGTSLSLDGGKPYLGVYNKKTDSFLIVSGGSGGASSDITLYQPNSGFATFDLAHYDGSAKKFVIPELLSSDPKMVDVILEVQGNWLKGTNSGKVRIAGMKDSSGSNLVLGECYVADPKNPKKIMSTEPSEGLVQPILQTFEENGEVVGLLLNGPSYYAGDGIGLINVGRGLFFEDGVLAVETVDEINSTNPSSDKIPTELAIKNYIDAVIKKTLAK